MSSLPAIIAALPREVALFTKGTLPDPKLKSLGIYLYRLPAAVVACAGMGSGRVTLAVQAALAAGSISSLVSAGLAGGCVPGLAVGSVIEAGVVVDTLTGVRFDLENGINELLVTTHTIAGIREKDRLFRTYGASVVDMEAATVARLAQINGLSLRVIKGISDGHDFELGALSRFASPHGHFRTGAFALHTALRPASWRHAVRLGSGSQRALRALAESLRQVVSHEE